MRISACIFDLGGTIVDRYSLTPFLSLKKAFERKGIYITNDLISKDMGKNKKEHISDILINFKVTNQWYNKYNDYPDDTDIESIFKDFNKIQTKYSDQVMDILPETKDCIEYLQFNYIKCFLIIFLIFLVENIIFYKKNDIRSSVLGEIILGKTFFLSGKQSFQIEKYPEISG